MLALTASMLAHADENPGYDRPGLGFSPAVLRTGDVSWEQGMPDWSHADGASLYTADTLLRLGVGGPFELQFGTSYNRQSSMDQTAWGRGDSSLGLKFALPAADNFSWGLLGSVTFTDGTHAFRGNDRQFLLGAAIDWQLNTRDALGAYMQTVHTHGEDDFLAAFDAGRALSDSLGAYAEVAWLRTANAGDGSMAGAGLAWQITPRVQLDGSFRHRLEGLADTWEAGLGVSVYFARP